MNSNQQTPNNPPHQQPDPIDQVLSALAYTEPPTGMDHRILQALEAQAAQPSPTPARPRWQPLQALRLLVRQSTSRLLGPEARSIPAQGRALGVQRRQNPSAEGATYKDYSRFIGKALFSAAALTIFAITVAALHHPTGSRPVDELAAANYAPAVHNPLQIDANDAHKQDPMPLLNPPPSVPRLTNLSAPPPPFRWVASTPTTPKTPSTLYPSPLTLVSYPAPSMPLTQQERLLLRIAHRDTPQTLTALTPEHFAAQQAQDNAAFQSFFPPPVPVEYPTLISQSNPPTPIHGDSK